MYYTITQGRKPEPYKWIRRQRYRGKAGTRMEKLLKALAMLPGGTGAEAEIVNIECKHVWWGHTSVLVYSQPAIKELKIILQITFLMCIHTCASAWICMYMETTSSGWVASSFLFMFSLVETGRLSLEEPGYHWLGSSYIYFSALQSHVIVRPRTSCLHSHHFPHWHMEPGCHWLSSLGDAPFSASQHCNHVWLIDPEHHAIMLAQAAPSH